MSAPHKSPQLDPSPSEADVKWVETILSSWATETCHDQDFPKNVTTGPRGKVEQSVHSDPVHGTDAGRRFDEERDKANEKRAGAQPRKTISRHTRLPAFTPLRKADRTLAFDRSDTPENEGCHTGVLRRPFSKGLPLLGAGILLAVLGFWTGSLLRKKGESETKSETAGRDAEHSSSVAGMIPEMKKAVQSFFAAQSPEEKSALVRGGEALLPAMRQYYQRHPLEPAVVKVDSNVEFVNDGGLEFVHLTGRSAAGDPFDAIVQGTPSGPRIDWRHLTGSGTLEWTDWLRLRPAKPTTLCVIATLDDYYAGPFTGPEKWICIKITDISRVSTVWAYADRKSATGVLLARELRDRKRVLKFRAAFEFPVQTGSASTLNEFTPQVVVRSIQRLDWIDRSPDVTKGSKLFSSLSP